MRLRVVQRTQAKRDFWEIVEYLTARNVSAAERFIGAVEDSLNFLSVWPETGTQVKDDAPEFTNLRVWQVKGFPNYLIIYRVNNETIEVLHLTPASRDLDALLDDR